MRVEATGGRRAGPAVLGAVLVMLATLLGGCLVPSPSEPTPTATRTAGAAGSKKIFLLRLIGICAGVNTFAAQKTEKDPEGPPPGAVADHLESLIGAAVANAPNVDTETFQRMVAGLSDLVRALRTLQQAGPADKEQAAQAVADAKARADKAAVSYGMPHLDDCNKSMQQDQVQQWQQLPSLPLAVQQIATAVVNGRIWVVGGLAGQDQASAKTFYFDPVLEKWFDGPPLPTPVSHAMAVAYHNTLVVIGGWIPIGAKIRGTTSAQVLRLQGDAWEPLASLNRPRAAGAAAVVGDRIVVVGGIDRDPVTTTELFDGSTWRDGAAIPVPGDHLAAVSDGKALYAVGGRKNLDPTQSTAALQRYDPAANTWKRLADMLTPRGGLAAAYADGRIYAVGGETVSSARNVVESYDVAADSWTPATTLPHGLHGLGVAVVGGTLYAIGGATEAGHSNSTAAVLGLSLSGPAGASVTVAGVATSDLSACPERMAVHWACLSSARLRSDGGLDIRYRTNFAPSAQQDPQHQHLHVFTARPDGHGGTIPAASAMQGDAGAQQGSWVTLYARDVAVIPRGARTSGTQRPLDTSAPLLCVRVAIGIHSLDKDLSGGLNTGNCVTIQR